MEKENHIQWAIYYPDHRDYYISLERETLKKIKNWDIIKSKIVYGSDRDIRDLAQKQLYISLMGDNERRTIMRETKITHTEEKSLIKNLKSVTKNITWKTPRRLWIPLWLVMKQNSLLSIKW